MYSYLSTKPNSPVSSRFVEHSGKGDTLKEVYVSALGGVKGDILLIADRFESFGGVGVFGRRLLSSVERRSMSEGMAAARAEGRGQRGAVGRKMSKSSAKRFAVAVCSNAHSFTGCVSCLWTLTYGKVFPSPAVAKRDLDVWLRRMQREFPGLFGWWCLECQKRGAPHFHGVASGFDDYYRFCYLGKEHWLDITGDCGTYNVAAREEYGFHCAEAYDVDGAMVYLIAELSKMAQKEFPEGVAPGRFWGAYGRQHFKSAVPSSPLSVDTFTAASRVRELNEVLLAGLEPQSYVWLGDSEPVLLGKTWFVGSAAQYIQHGTPGALDAWMRVVGAARLLVKQQIEEALKDEFYREIYGVE